MPLNSKQPNILIVVPNDSLGGAEQYLKMIATYFLDECGAAVSVIFLKKLSTGNWEDLNIHSLYGKTNKERHGVFSLIKHLYSHRKTVFDYTFTSHVHTNGFLGLMRNLKILRTKHLIGRESTTIFTRYTGSKLLTFKILYKIGYSGIDLLICQSDFMKEQLIKGIPTLEEKTKIKVLQNPVNLEAIKEKSNEGKKITTIAVPYLVSAGRFIDEKGFDILINSFKILKDKHIDLKLLILGEGHLRPKLETQIKALDLTNEVILPGFVDNVYPFFKNARACVVSSRIEGFPNVLLQMMSQNNTIVSTLCAGGIDEIKGIITARPKDEEDLTRAIDMALAVNSIENRALFDAELASRDISEFINKVKLYLSSNSF